MEMDKKRNMNKTNQKTPSSNGPIADAVYYLLNILLFPVTLLGYVIQVAYLFLPGRKRDVSTMAQAPLSDRWTQHHLGVREDEAANRLRMALPGAPPLSFYLVSSPTLLAHRLTGYVPKPFRYPFEGEITLGTERGARQTFFDSVLKRYLPGTAQLVILGAGFDTRALRLKGAPVRRFEIDAPATQAVKREMLAKAGIDSNGVIFVSADFETEDWRAKLIEASFDPGKPTLFIWEGVMMYLDREAVEDTLRKIASTAQGSIAAFDYFTSEVLESKALFMRTVRASLNSFGEPLKFGIDSTPPSRECLAELLESCGLSLIEQRTLGQETEGKRAWGGFAIAIVKE
jgi:methyltransferase (TIGR00027 family)